MRIIAGIWRGRPLTAPAGHATRPTSDRTREALFSMLASRLGTFEGLRVVDLFAGSGALGFEALSRGAAHCTFVEQDSAAIAAIRANAAKLGATADIRTQSATVFAGGPFDLIFADAPYGSGLGQQALARVALAPGGWASIETARDEAVTVPGFVVAAERVHGKARLTLLQPA
ncbi:16S rRNA (guanine(966)-N(2))-methyltransferase RsmD [Sphingomonas flavalba]|uniref:16S rRNA (guanine(966)-N(2))-methyltransferase RsmD n=1 Tax=Sphingomonas flavalba TaxID=2559804 RepID=UPI0039E10592